MVIYHPGRAIVEVLDCVTHGRTQKTSNRHKSYCIFTHGTRLNVLDNDGLHTSEYIISQVRFGYE